MYHIEELFDKRSVVGARLEKILEEKGLSKVELGKGSGVSRPTIDKVLAGTLTSKTNYEKHIKKILDYLEMTPDMFLGNTVYRQSRARKIRNLRKITTEQMAQMIELPLERLQEIEAGEEATIAELRDIAMCLSISVRVLQGENFFEPQIGEMDHFVDASKDEETKAMSGFWGHIGILPGGTDKYLWFPITRNTQRAVRRTMNNERLIIPCMNNKVLYLYMPNIKEILLLDEACDAPGDADWDSNVSEGEIPLVVYEALEDYVMGDIDNENMTEKMRGFLADFVCEKGWDEGDIFNILRNCIIYFADGKIRLTDIDFYGDENISTEISEIYDFEENEFAEDILWFTDENGMETIINMKHVAMLELPLLAVEKAICDGNDMI